MFYSRHQESETQQQNCLVLVLDEEVNDWQKSEREKQDIGQNYN